ncbi:MAG TPA: 1-deoxy-D-xylulose-5-phosphate synthase [Planctomycetaceae bacterium]|nr:1-deoxy-D-xylulose-5-phosphate synthase [Planctomycetaceae bacterium]
MGHAGWLHKNITIILNDNKMSICPRVGGISSYLDRLRMAKSYLGFKHRVRVVIRNLPFVNKFAERFLGGFKSAIKAAFLGGMLFEELGFRYIGPIDGHDIGKLQNYLRLVRMYEEPVLLHVFTEKGRGFDAAVDDPTAFHAPSPGLVGRHTGKNRFDLYSSDHGPRDPEPGDSGVRSLKESHQSAIRSTRPVPFTQHVRDAVLEVMRDNERVCAVSAAMVQGTMMEPVREEFPSRFFDVGICESHAILFASGLAKAGLRPMVAIYSTFMQRGYDQIFQEVSLQNLPVTLLLDRAGLAATDGPTHHGVFDIAYLRPFPNLVVLTPGDAADVEPMIRFAATHAGPVAIRYPKADATLFSREVAPVEPGKSERLRDGEDGFIVVCGGHVDIALESAKELGKNLDGRGRVDLGVINARFIKPLDKEGILGPLRNGKFLLIVEEGVLAGGFGSAVLEAANEEGLDTRLIRRLGIGDRYIPHAERSEQLEELGFTEANFSRLVRELQCSAKKWNERQG